MTRPTLLMLHGWGFDASLWDGVARYWPGEMVRWDRGYFGPRQERVPSGPMVAVGHSLGAMILARKLSPQVPLLAINGFDRFTGVGAVPPRMVARMQVRFGEAPARVLNDFRRRCGGPATMQPFAAAMLADDLALLASSDAPMLLPRRIRVLHGAQDPILPAELRARAFPSALRIVHEDAGHLLPLTHPQFCAEQIDAFVWR